MKLQVQGISEPIEVIRSKRKSIGIQIYADGRIVARIPQTLAESELEQFLLQKRELLEEHLRKACEKREQSQELPGFTREEIYEMAEKASEIIPERVAFYAEKLGVNYGKITIRNQKTKWGSCSARGNLNFNCILMAAPPEVLDAVVAHELCHRIYMNHSKEFYVLLRHVFPEYDKWNHWLKENGMALMKRMEH